MFIRRSKAAAGAGTGHNLQLRMIFFAVGAALALGGMALEIEWLMNVALVVLLVGFALRFIGPKATDESSPDHRPEA